MPRTAHTTRTRTASLWHVVLMAIVAGLLVADVAHTANPDQCRCSPTASPGAAYTVTS